MLNRSNIEEANKHLQALYGRIGELEHVIAEQHDALLAKDSFIQTKVRELAHQDAVIHSLKQQLAIKDTELEDANQKISHLETRQNATSAELEILGRRNEAFRNVVSVIPELKSLVMRMENIVVGVDECNSHNGHIWQSTVNSPAADGDNTIVTLTGQDNSSISSGPVSEMTREFNTKSERMKKFSISEDDEAVEDSPEVNDNRTRLKELYF